MTPVQPCGDHGCPCQRPHTADQACACGCGRAHCTQCGEVFPCTTETRRRHAAFTEAGDQ